MKKMRTQPGAEKSAFGGGVQLTARGLIDAKSSLSLGLHIFPSWLHHS